MKRESMSLSQTGKMVSKQQQLQEHPEDLAAAAVEAQQKSLAMSQALEQEMAAKFNLKNPQAARVGAQAAMKFMTGLNRNKQAQEQETAAAVSAAAARMCTPGGGGSGGGEGGEGGAEGGVGDIYGE